MSSYKSTKPSNSVFGVFVETAQTPERLTRMPEIEQWGSEIQEGQLAIDIIDAGKELIAVTALAGAQSDKLEIYIHNDLLTIRGERSFPVSITATMEYVHQECFWGRFSRSVVLPVDVRADAAKAEYKNGILVVKIPKRHTEAKVPITIVEE